MTTLDLRGTLDRDGFVVIPGFLAGSELSHLNENLDRYVRDVVPALPDADAFFEDKSQPETLKQLQRMGCDAYFEAYRNHPRWVQAAEQVLGEAALAEQPEWFNKPPGTRHVTPPHQDNYYFCLKPAQVITIWLALDQVDAENGCLRYVAGSHLEGYRPHTRSQILGFSQGISDYGPSDFAREVVVSLQPGDAVAHHGMTIHRADANMSAVRHRRSFAMVFRGVSCERDNEAFERYLQSARSQHQSMGLNV
jgi:phytanoyl-CoA hydroxylase